jgi:hypothetical protein
MQGGCGEEREKTTESLETVGVWRDDRPGVGDLLGRWFGV